MKFTYTAGFDSANSQNGSLNVASGTVELEFASDVGDFEISNDPVTGQDENTVVFIDGVEYSFSYVETGILPGGTQPGASADTGDKIPTILEGATVICIRVEDYDADGDGIGDGPQQFFFTPDYLAGTEEADAIYEIGDRQGGGLGVKLDNLSTDPPPPICFLAGTLVATLKGSVVVDDLRPGDVLLTKDNGLQPVAWVSSSIRVWSENEDSQKPILIARGALDVGLPKCDLCVSPQHHILFKSQFCLGLFGVEEVLAPAKGLTGLPGVRVMSGKRSAEYYHVMTAQHEILTAHGVETESFYPGPTAVRMLNAGQRASLFAVVPELRDDPENGYGPTARKRITRRQAEQLVDAMKAEKKKTVVAGE